MTFPLQGNAGQSPSWRGGRFVSRERTSVKDLGLKTEPFPPNYYIPGIVHLCLAAVALATVYASVFLFFGFVHRLRWLILLILFTGGETEEKRRLKSWPKVALQITKLRCLKVLGI